MKTPLFFGAGDRRLLGIYSPAAAGGKQAVLLCHPWGQEYLRAHRAMNLLTKQLTAAGSHVMSFDYYGTGDSGGDMVDASIAGWEADIATAIEELRDTTGVNKVGLVGLRLGATLAARVAARQRKLVDALVLWDPVVSGAAYVDELLTLSLSIPFVRKQPLTRPPSAGGGHEVMGFALTDAFAKQLQSVELSDSLAEIGARTLIVASTRHELHGSLKALATAPAALPTAKPRHFEELPSPPAWLEDGNKGSGAISVPLLQTISGWLTR